MSGRPLGRRSLGAPSSSSSSDSAKTAPISRIPKRAHSIAPSDLKPKAGSTAAAAAAANNVLRDRENQTQPITSSTRPAMGPRKSSIRTRPPQVFASPTGMSRSPTAPPPRQSVAGGDASVVVTTTIAAASTKKRPAAGEEVQSPSAAARSRKSMAAPAFSDSKTVDVNEERKRRRVTFSTRQERTDFIRDEPTMHIRPPVESDLASMSQSTGSSTPSSQRDSLVPRLRGFGEDVDDDESESSSEEESSEEEEEEDASAIDMELATMSDIVAPRAQEAVDDDEESMAMDFTQVRGTIVRGRRSSTAPSEADESSVAMDLTYAGDDGQGEEDESAMEFTTAVGGIQSMGKGKLRARDSLAARPSFAKARSSLLPPPTASAANESSMMSMDMDDASKSAMDITGNFGAIADEDEDEEAAEETQADAEDKSAMMSLVGANQSSSAMDLTVAQGTIVPGDTTPRKSRPSSTGSALPSLPFQRSPTKSPGTPSRFRRSLLGGISDSPSSPARRVQVPIDPEELARMKPATPSAVSKDFSSQFLTLSARRASPERPPIFANAMPLRKSMGGALPSAHALKPGKVSTAPQQKSRGDNRSSIVAAVLPAPSSSDFSYDGTEESNNSAAEAAITAAAAMGPPSQVSSSASGSEEHPFYDAHHSVTRAPSPPLDDEISQPPLRNLTLSEFFSLSGMNFHDDTRPLKVRVLPPRDGPPSLEGSKRATAQFKAMAGSVPMLETLVDACRELKQSVSDGSAVLKEIEERFVDSPPDLVRELLSLSSEAEKKEMESQFKLQKQAARAIAKEGYLGWCLDNQYGPDIVAALEATKRGLEQDLLTIKADCARMEQEILPVLRERRNLLRAQVQRVKSRQKEIELCPLSDLEALHGGMAELLPEVQSRRSVHREKSDSLERMRAKLEENLATKAELEAGIEAARQVCEQIQGYTRGEAARLAAEVRHIERVHLWKIHSASLGKLHLVHDSVFDVVVFLDQDGTGLCESVELALTPSAKLAGDVLVGEMLEALREDLLNTEAHSGVQGWPVAKLVRHISTAWTSCRHLQSDLARLALRFPIDVTALAAQQLAGEPRNVAVHATMLLPEERTKLRLALRVDMEALIYGDDAALFSRRVESDEDRDESVEVAGAVRIEAVYGQADAAGMAQRVARRLRSHDFVLGSGALAEACASVVDSFA
ncbi:hypothetical protein BDZ90DRAFT_276590 [Jaminaea rosea]|uniref:Spc7 kinetochore protein domain-containing protein n=1 Tax=Jaminaea rosea TaxID=1569628 RepID=A0A316UXR1_9BASI|nr:hypothetical protein BDZ90DRAFT_276590 [Jaminaea rosea]PWN30096.1 hypothetical protein BDZ90DRAFT_276590 [Jaminaea rosea]